VYLLARGGSGDAPTSSPAAPPAAPPVGSAAAPAPPAPPPPKQATNPAPPRQDLGEQTKLRILRVFAAFAQWSPAHGGAACPTARDLIDARGDAHDLDDPWGHPIAITCTDQPADQIIGAIALGPDGVLGTDDDVPSWTLGRDVTSFVRGPRWKTSHHSSSPSTTRTTSRTTAPSGATAPATDIPRTTDIPRKPAEPPPARPAGDDDIPRVRK
jgi:hypothetical protein